MKTRKKLFFFWALAGLGIFAVCSILFLSLEYYARIRGYRPGVFHNNFSFKYQDSLIVYDNLVADRHGMNYFTAHFFAEMAGECVNPQGFIGPYPYDTLTRNYFRRKGSISIMIIGDSFVEGHSNEWGKNFAENLRKMHPAWGIYAFGVAGTNLDDYLHIAKRFAPILQPDLVVVCISWNDVTGYRTPMVPFVPRLYMTNCGLMMSTAPGEYSGGKRIVLHSAQQAYQYYANTFTLMTRAGFLMKVCRKSCVCTNLYWRWWKKRNYINVPKEEELTGRILNEIFEVEMEMKTKGKCIAVFVPDVREVDQLTSLEKYQNRYRSDFGKTFSKVHFPLGYISSRSYISWENSHFNDEGNRAYAQFLDSIIFEELAILSTKEN